MVEPRTRSDAGAVKRDIAEPDVIGSTELPRAPVADPDRPDAAESGSGPESSTGLRGTLLAVVSGYLALRALGVLALALLPPSAQPTRSGEAPRSLIELLSIWDGGWYVRIAESGYADRLDLSAPLADQSTGSLAFFPIYPGLLRAVTSVTGLDPRWAGVLISLASGAFAAAGVALLARDWLTRDRWRSDRRSRLRSRPDLLDPAEPGAPTNVDPRTNQAERSVGSIRPQELPGWSAPVLAGWLWAAAPMGIVTALVYSESLFTALAVWTFVALRRHWWWSAGLLALLAGLTRPTGIAVGAAVGLYVISWLVSIRRSADGGGGADRSTRPRRIPALLCAVAAVAATPLFWLWVAQRAGRWDAWFVLQAEFWGTEFDGGRWLVDLVGNLVTGRTVPGTTAVAALVVICVVGSVLLLIVAARQRLWWPLLVYAAVSLVILVGSTGYFSSKLRFLVPIMVLTLPLAGWLARRGRGVQVCALATAAVLSLSVGSYLVAIWAYAI